MTIKNRIFITGIISLGIWGLLAWNYFNGGVPSHHIFARKDLPSISNWWGGLLIPLLSWYLLYRINKRTLHSQVANATTIKIPASVIYAFIGSLLFGALISISFNLGYSGATGYIMLSAFVMALFIPIYRSEYLLGFVLAMTYTFGGVLPTAIGSIIIAIATIIYLIIRGGALYLYKKTFMEK